LTAAFSWAKAVEKMLARMQSKNDFFFIDVIM
jgi:hypothetical protein